MTLYTRGYRRYEDGFKSRPLRFTPIFVEGYREAVRSRSFRLFQSLFVAAMLLFAVIYYLIPRSFAPAGCAEALRVKVDEAAPTADDRMNARRFIANTPNRLVARSTF